MSIVPATLPHQVLRVLDHLPLTTKNQLEENKLLPLVKKWREIPLRKTKTNLSPKGTKVSFINYVIVNMVDKILMSLSGA